MPQKERQAISQDSPVLTYYVVETKHPNWTVRSRMFLAVTDFPEKGKMVLRFLLRSR